MKTIMYFPDGRVEEINHPAEPVEEGYDLLERPESELTSLKNAIVKLSKRIGLNDNETANLFKSETDRKEVK